MLLLLQKALAFFHVGKSKIFETYTASEFGGSRSSRALGGALRHGRRLRPISKCFRWGAHQAEGALGPPTSSPEAYLTGRQSNLAVNFFRSNFDDVLAFEHGTIRTWYSGTVPRIFAPPLL